MKTRRTTRKPASDLALFDTSSLSFTRAARVAADNGTFVSADHAWNVATAVGEASATDVRAAYALAPRNDGFVSFEVA